MLDGLSETDLVRRAETAISAMERRDNIFGKLGRRKWKTGRKRAGPS